MRVGGLLVMAATQQVLDLAELTSLVAHDSVGDLLRMVKMRDGIIRTLREENLRLTEFIKDWPAHCENCETCRDEAHKALKEGE